MISEGVRWGIDAPGLKFSLAPWFFHFGSMPTHSCKLKNNKTALRFPQFAKAKNFGECRSYATSRFVGGMKRLTHLQHHTHLQPHLTHPQHPTLLTHLPAVSPHAPTQLTHLQPHAPHTPYFTPRAPAAAPVGTHLQPRTSRTCTSRKDQQPAPPLQTCTNAVAAAVLPHRGSYVWTTHVFVCLKNMNRSDFVHASLDRW